MSQKQIAESLARARAKAQLLSSQVSLPALQLLEKTLLFLKSLLRYLRLVAKSCCMYPAPLEWWMILNFHLSLWVVLHKEMKLQYHIMVFVFCFCFFFLGPGEVLWFLCLLSQRGQKCVVVVYGGEVSDYSQKANSIIFLSYWYFWKVECWLCFIQKKNF